MVRDDLGRFAALDIEFGSIGLMEPGVPQVPYFCDPIGAEHVGRIGCDGVHFVLLPEDGRVFCVDPVEGEPGTYVLPVAEDLRQFLSFVLSCQDAALISEIWRLDAERFRASLAENARRPVRGEFQAKKKAALRAIQKAFALTPADPYDKVKALQAAFDPSCLRFPDEYYDVLGLACP